MNGLRLAMHAPPERSLDLGELNPQSLAGKSVDAIARMRLSYGSRLVALGDLFGIDGEPGGDLRLVGVDSRCHRIGRGLTEGTIEVTGNVGDELGREMRGGAIRVRGNTGDAMGAGMRGGSISVTGSAGDRAGGLVPGAVRGMNGGLILVGKSAGDYTGERMRRGCILVAGNAGAMTGDRMIAGTIAVLGRCGANTGLGMRRGTLLLAQAPKPMTATFNDCGTFELPFIAVLRDYVATHHRAFSRRLDAFRRARRWCGDMAYGGRGEILVAVDS